MKFTIRDLFLVTMILASPILAGCGGGTVESDDVAIKRFEDQADAFDRQTNRVNRMIETQEAQAKRYDKILDKMEEQLRRQDAILEANERKAGIKPTKP